MLLLIFIRNSGGILFISMDFLRLFGIRNFWKLEINFEVGGRERKWGRREKDYGG